MKSYLQIAALALMVSIAGRLAGQAWDSSRNEKLTGDLCGVVGNYLEVGSLREAFEGMSQGLARSGHRNACVGIIDNGRSYAPDCMDPAQSYQTSLCKAEGNKGIRAEIRYPTSPLLGLDLLWLTLCVGLALTLAASGLRVFTNFLAAKISQEIEAQLANGNSAEAGTGVFSQLIDWSMDRLGISASIRDRISPLENQLRAFELRVREEAALRARKEADAAKAGEYIEKVRQIRHDIRAPLSALFALKDVVEGDDLARRTLGSAISRIEAMVEDLNQVDQASSAPRLAIVEVLAEESAATIRQKFLLGKGVTVSLEYGANLSPVMIEPGQFRRILDNLLENAFDASSQNGNIRLLISRNERECTIAVEDNGVGIRPENLARLFTKGGTFGKVNGLGLGLYHAKRSLEAWSGGIACEPLAIGTRITITLPLAQVGVGFVGLLAVGPLSVVDDDPAVARALAASGHDVIYTAATFAEGEELLKTKGAAETTTLIDYRLDGTRLGTELIEAHANRQPMLLCTADFDDAELIRKARHLGIKILPKPLCFYSEQRPFRQPLSSVK
jgi:signal transduction histidine kinase